MNRQPITDLQREAKLELFAALAVAEAAAASGDTGVDFSEFAEKLRGKIHGAV